MINHLQTAISKEPCNENYDYLNIEIYKCHARMRLFRISKNLVQIKKTDLDGKELSEIIFDDNFVDTIVKLQQKLGEDKVVKAGNMLFNYIYKKLERNKLL